MKTTEVLTNFFMNVKHNCQRVASWYNTNMEVQINVAPCGGDQEKVGVFSDDIQPYKWYNVRIPKNANSNPIDNDSNLAYPLDKYVDAIGMTGWDWRNKKSIRFGFDYDSIVGHAQGVGVSNEELELVKSKALDLPEILVLKSTGGSGLHLYLECDPNNLPDTATHTEHAALALAALKDISTRVGFDFHNHLDVGGGNMWVWALKMTEENQGLTVLKDNVHDDGSQAYYTPVTNWRDYIDVAKGKRTRPRLQGVNPDDQQLIDNQEKSQKVIELTSEHERLIADLHSECPDTTTVWLENQNLLQTHTVALKRVLKQGEYKGIFDTLSNGADLTKPNCFGYPQEDGSWRFIRFGRGTNEAMSWSKSEDGWTYCHVNKQAAFNLVALFHNGIEDDKGGFTFQSTEDAMQAAASLGTSISIPEELQEREITFKKHSGDRIKVEVIRRQKKDENLQIVGWLKKGQTWYKIFNKDSGLEEQTDQVFVEIDSLDKYVRSIVNTDYSDAGWSVKHQDGIWMLKGKEIARIALATTPFQSELPEAMATAVYHAWIKVNLPFQEEYPGGRKWNKDSAQFKYKPANLEPDETPEHPNWDMILKHISQDLTAYLSENTWCRDNNIFTGYQYIMCWITSMFKSPFQPLPYLFFHGPQGSGKSILHEALALLMTRGVVKADQALTNSSGFNGELESAILCVVEEKNIADHPDAYNRLKDWVTATELSIHAKFKEVRMQDNTTHWMHMANEATGCPIFPGDTRINSIYVPPFKEKTEIPKPELLELLRNEAPHFLETIKRFNLPESDGRLMLPIITTASKSQQSEANRNSLEEFLDERCVFTYSGCVVFDDFYDAFVEQLHPAESPHWTKRRVSLSLPVTMPIGKFKKIKTVGNLMLDEQYTEALETGEIQEFNVDGTKYTPTVKFIRENDKLVSKKLTREELYG